MLGRGVLQTEDRGGSDIRNQTVAGSHRVAIDGNRFTARRGELLLDAALRNGIDLPHDCRAGHCGTCCIRLVSGEVLGGQGSEAGIVHACQCRVIGDAVLASRQTSGVRSVDGVLSSLCALSPDVMEVGIRTQRSLPYHAGQYVKVQFRGYPNRPFSLTHPLRSNPNTASLWFHVRRINGGRVTSSLGTRITLGHRVKLNGPYGSAHFRSNQQSRVILVATSTGFAPIWSIAVAALREDPERHIRAVIGARTMASLYMGGALAQLRQFPNVEVIPVCSTLQTSLKGVRPGRPTEYLPPLLPTDVLYACGAPEMVDAIKTMAAASGAACHADPFLLTSDATVASIFTRAVRWILASPSGRRSNALAMAATPCRDSG